MRPPKPRFEPKAMPPIPWQSNVRDLITTLGLVWQANPLQASLIGLLSLAQAFVPVATLWISKLLLDAIAGAIGGQGSSVEVAFAQLLNLLLIQVGISVVSSLLSTVQTANRELLGDTLQNRISKRILEKSTQLELQQFEDPETYDRLQVAYREVGTRPLGVFTQIITLFQAVITLVSVSALMSQLGWGVVPLVLLATLPGIWVSSRFGTEGYRMLRRQAQEARVQNYLGQLLTSDTAMKEVRLFGFEEYLLGRWQAYYQKFRVQLTSLILRRSAWGLWLL